MKYWYRTQSKFPKVHILTERGDTLCRSISTGALTRLDKYTVTDQPPTDSVRCALCARSMGPAAGLPHSALTRRKAVSDPQNLQPRGALRDFPAGFYRSISPESRAVFLGRSDVRRLLNPGQEGFTRRDLSDLGYSWPPIRGWRSKLIAHLGLTEVYRQGRTLASAGIQRQGVAR